MGGNSVQNSCSVLCPRCWIDDTEQTSLPDLFTNQTVATIKRIGVRQPTINCDFTASQRIFFTSAVTYESGCKPFRFMRDSVPLALRLCWGCQQAEVASEKLHTCGYPVSFFCRLVGQARAFRREDAGLSRRLLGFFASPKSASPRFRFACLASGRGRQTPHNIL